MENKARYIKTIYDYKKFVKPDFRKMLCYEYKGYIYTVYPDAWYIQGYELATQHRNEQESIDKMIEQIEENKYREEHPEEFANHRTCEEQLDYFFRFLDGEIDEKEYFKKVNA